MVLVCYAGALLVLVVVECVRKEPSSLDCNWSSFCDGRGAKVWLIVGFGELMVWLIIEFVMPEPPLFG